MDENELNETRVGQKQDWTKTGWTKAGWTKMNWTKSGSTVSLKDGSKPWFYTEIKNHIKTKQRFFYLFKWNLLTKLLYLR